MIDSRRRIHAYLRRSQPHKVSRASNSYLHLLIIYNNRVWNPANAPTQLSPRVFCPELITSINVVSTDHLTLYSTSLDIYQRNRQKSTLNFRRHESETSTHQNTIQTHLSSLSPSSQTLLTSNSSRNTPPDNFGNIVNVDSQNDS